jgi:monoamine oxidase
MATIRHASALTRRAVLGGIASGAAGLAVGPGCCPPPLRDTVVIVGAGAAGIGAALALQEAGRSYQIFEAAGRIGGRAFTDTTTFDAPFDVGCAWIHADNLESNSMMRKVVEWKEEGKWKSVTFDQGTWASHDDGALEFSDVFYGCSGRMNTDAVKSELPAAEEKLKNAIRNEVAKGEAGDVAVDRLVSDWRWPGDVVATAMGPMDAAVNLYDLSAADIAAAGDYNHNVLLKNGYGTVIQLLAKAVPPDRLHTGTRVTEVRASANGVRVITDKAGGVDAGAVIVTVSTGVLAGRQIKFWDGSKQDLPHEHQDAIDNLPMGLLAKIPLWVPNAVHDMLKESGINDFANVLSQRPDLQSVYFLVCPFNPNLVVGFVGGDFAWSLARKVPQVHQGSAPPEDAVEKVRQEAVALAWERLAELFGCNVKRQADSREASRAFFTDWGWNPLTRGAYAAARPGKFGARAALRKPAFERIYFAGEAVAEHGWHATCHGAYDSGRKVADDVMQMLDSKA